MSFIKTFLPLFLISVLQSCNQPEPSEQDEAKVEVEISDEKLDHLGITNHNYLSAASKRALAWPDNLTN